MKRFTLPFAVALAVTPPVFAQDAGLPDRPIRRAEVVNVVKQQLTRLDADRNGVVDQAEFQAYLVKRDAARARGDDRDDQGFAHIGRRWFERSDENGDGKVTLAEAEMRPLKLFDLADVNHDGVVSLQERKVALLLTGK